MVRSRRGSWLSLRPAARRGGGSSLRGFAAWLSALLAPLALPAPLALLAPLSLWASLALLGACSAEQAPFEITRGNPHLIWRAELAIVDAERPPVGAEYAHVAWQPVELPDTWRRTERWKTGLNGWYRIRLAAGPAPSEATSVYLWRFSMNAAVWFNGEFIGDGGSFAEPVARNWNRPLIFALPRALWRSVGDNELHVRLRTYPGYGHLMPVAVGPTTLLQPEHDRREFMQVTLSQIAAGITLLALVTGAILWWVDRNDAAMPYFVGFCLLWLAYGAYSWLRDIPVSAKAWWWVVHTSADLSYWIAACCFHRLMGARRPRIETLLLAWGLVCAALYAWADLPRLAQLNPVTHGITALAGIYLSVWVVRRWFEAPGPERAVFALAFLTIFASGVFDMLLNSLLLPQLWRSHFYVAHLVAPLMFLGLIATLALRAARGVRAVRAANAELEARVRQASTEITTAYERERVLLAERSAADERERIYRDLHDNLGARLLSMVYGARDEQQAALARDALAEMRSLVASGALKGGRLAELATDWRVEAELRCEAAGIELHWQQADEAGAAMLSALARLQLERMLRELLSNAIEHAQPRRIQVALAADGDGLALEVSDDGRGIGDPAHLDGHGIRSVRERARQIAGQAAWRERAGGGTTCTVRLPLAGAEGAA